jgi:hypothetical protein
VIPDNIKREHILKAIQEIDRLGVPVGREGRSFSLIYEGKKYPPKYIISLANKYANGKDLDPSRFSGGKETNSFLTSLTFQIITGKQPKVRLTQESHFPIQHDERCKKCKDAIYNLLTAVYGKVERNYTGLSIRTLPKDYQNSPYYNALENIFKKLQIFKEHKNFVKSERLSPCDFYIPNGNFIVEFDESQHFSLPRKLSLEHYPEDIKLSYDKERWIKLCEEILAKDNDPPYRDEQRAWYDTLKDFVPVLYGLNPTVRLHASDIEWCRLNAKNPTDINKFKMILQGKSSNQGTVIRQDKEPYLARIIIAGKNWKGQISEVKNLLEKTCSMWPMNKKVKFLVTCGGFIQFDWPNSIIEEEIRDNKNPDDGIVEALTVKAKEAVESVLSNHLYKRLANLTDYITLGVDSKKNKISMTKNYIDQYHIELVYLVDVKKRKLYWSGKSYPTPNQEDYLIRIKDLSKHFFFLEDIGQVMILGCHDLTAFNPRAFNRAKGWRKILNKQFRQIAKIKRPHVALQHPHTTDSILTWTASWNSLVSEIPSVKVYASAGTYFRQGGQRSDIEKLLEKTKNIDSIDFIFR